LYRETKVKTGSKMLESLPMWIAAMTFIAVIVVIMFEWLHITVAALLEL